MIVVDCSAVVDALVGAPGSQELVDLLAAEDLHAPDLIDYEMVAALRGLVLGCHISVERAEEALADFDDLPLQRWAGDAALRRRAFQLRHVVSAYDAAYIALAEAMNRPLITRDQRLARTTGHAIEVRVL